MNDVQKHTLTNTETETLLKITLVLFIQFIEEVMTSIQISGITNFSATLNKILKLT